LFIKGILFLNFALLIIRSLGNEGFEDADKGGGDNPVSGFGNVNDIFWYIFDSSERMRGYDEQV
jgi:hypothetical protein